MSTAQLRVGQMLQQLDLIHPVKRPQTSRLQPQCLLDMSDLFRFGVHVINGVILVIPISGGDRRCCLEEEKTDTHIRLHWRTKLI